MTFGTAYGRAAVNATLAVALQGRAALMAFAARLRRVDTLALP